MNNYLKMIENQNEELKERLAKYEHLYSARNNEILSKRHYVYVVNVVDKNGTHLTWLSSEDKVDFFASTFEVINEFQSDPFKDYSKIYLKAYISYFDVINKNMQRKTVWNIVFLNKHNTWKCVEYFYTWRYGIILGENKSFLGKSLKAILENKLEKMTSI